MSLISLGEVYKVSPMRERLQNPLQTLPQDLRELRVPALRELFSPLLDRVVRGEGWRMAVPRNFERIDAPRSETTGRVEGTWLVPSQEQKFAPRLVLLSFSTGVVDRPGEVEAELAAHLVEREEVNTTGSAPCCGWYEGVVNAGIPERVHWVRKGPKTDALDAVGLSYRHPHQPKEFVLAAIYLAGGSDSGRMSETLVVRSRSLAFDRSNNGPEIFVFPPT
jgi:hypothetical protein